jgi:hypothetical protein
MSSNVAPRKSALSEDMFVAIRKRSSFDGSLAADEQVVTSIGTTYLRVQPGEYEVLVRDERFGWKVGNRGEFLVRDTGAGTLAVQRDLSASVKPPMELSACRNMVAGSGVPTVDFPKLPFPSPFLWNGKSYKLTCGQSLAVDGLAAGFVASRPDVPDGNVIRSIPEALRSGDSLEQNFRNADGPLAWGKLVVPGQEPGTHRLARIPTAKIVIDVRTPGMQAELVFTGKHVGAKQVSDRQISFFKTGKHELAVWPGTYDVRLIDSQVHWFDQRGVCPIPSRTEELTVKDGDSATFVAERHWQDYVRPKFSLRQESLPDAKACYWFTWFDTHERRVGLGQAGFPLNQSQAAFVSRLLQGLVDGKPDVAEDELLKAADAKPMSGLFPGMDGKPLRDPRIQLQHWESLFVPGAQPRTWRLNVPVQTQTHPADAAGPRETLSDEELARMRKIATLAYDKTPEADAAYLGLAAKVRQAREQRDAAKAIEKLKGRVHFQPNWLRNLFGEDLSRDVIGASLRDTAAADAELVHLQSLPHLQELWLDGTQVAGPGLKHLNGLTKLTSLALAGSMVTDAGLEHVPGLAQLEWLDLSNTQVTDAGLAHLQRLTQLGVLGLENTRVTGVGLQHLKGTQLRSLHLDKSEVTDAGLAHVGGLQHLEGLWLDGTKIGDAGLTQLGGLKHLKDLRLAGTKVTDAGLAHLGQLKELQQLSLQGTQVTDTGLAHLRGLAQLQLLNIENTRATDAGVNELQKTLPNLIITR